MSLDGLIELIEAWRFDYIAGDQVAEQLATADAIILGRATYEVPAGPARARAARSPAASTASTSSSPRYPSPREGEPQCQMLQRRNWAEVAVVAGVAR
jgi:hypothetical protein